MQLVFEGRIDLADAALQAAEPPLFELTVNLLARDLDSLPEDCIAVREKWRTKRSVAQSEVLQQWSPVTVATFRSEMASLMQWVNMRGYTEAHELDLLMTRMQIEILRGSGRFDNYKIPLFDKVNSLQMHLNPVREKGEIIKRIRSSAFWDDVTASDLEKVRKQLRAIIHHGASSGSSSPQVRLVDIAENVSKIEKGRARLLYCVRRHEGVRESGRRGARPAVRH